MEYTTPNDDGVTVITETVKYRITHNPYADTFPFTLWVTSIFHDNWVMDSKHPTESRANTEAVALGLK